MGSSQTTNSNSNRTGTESINYDPRIMQQMQTGMAQFGDLMRSRTTAPINLQGLPGYSATPSALTTNFIAKGVQGINAAEGAANRQLAGSLSQAGTGNNSALLAALSRQGQISSAGARNALVPQGFAIQRQLDEGLNTMVSSNNQQKLAARQQSVAEIQPYLNLLQVLGGLGQATAGRTRTETSEEYSKTKGRKGILGLF